MTLHFSFLVFLDYFLCYSWLFLTAFFFCLCTSFPLSFRSLFPLPLLFGFIFLPCFVCGWHFHFHCFHIWLLFPSEFYCLILHSEVREGEGILCQLQTQEIYSALCLNLCASLLFQGFDLMDSCQLLHEIYISSADIYTHRDYSIVTSRNSVKDYILCACRVVGGYFSPVKI